MGKQCVVLVTFPSCQLLDIAGPLDVFEAATRVVPRACYQTVIVSVNGGPVSSTSGLSLTTTPIASVRSPIDTLVIVGGDGTAEASHDADLLRHVRRLASRANRVTAVCTGAFVLAATGLLDKHRAVTHWEWCDLLQHMYPEVTVESEPIYVRDGNVWTSAGVTAGIDLALALVAEDHGNAAANRVARQLVVYLRRSGGQAQYSIPLAAQSIDDGHLLTSILSWVVDHLDSNLTVNALANRAHLSQRQFSRVFTAHVGTTPARYIEALRIEAARRLLETTTKPMEAIAAACGFGTPETMNRAFRRRTNTTPTGHRKHFGMCDGLGGSDERVAVM
jgi:transcriptional regulator GlxA family with amidase domain